MYGCGGMNKKVYKRLKDLIQTLHEEYGWFNEEELKNTPKRIARFYEEWQRNQSFKFTLFRKETDQLIVLKNIEFYSLCSHHLLPFFGKVHIGYLPSKKICGVSKLARAVVKFASKPQIQEKMTEELADYIFQKLKPKFVMVVVEAQHLCMLMRGIKQHNSVMVTSAIRVDESLGKEGGKTLKEEFLNLVKEWKDRKD